MDENSVAQACIALWRRLDSVEPGLDDSEIDRMSSAVGTAIPEQLELFLRSGRPVGRSWPDWRDPEEEVAQTQQDIRRRLAFDLEHCEYWFPDWGERPDGLGAAIDQAWAIVRTWSPLIRVFGHRYVVADGIEPAPVLSVWQFVDSIWYGNDLVDWIDREFGVTVPNHAPPPTRELRGWTAAFDLDNTGWFD